MKPLEHIKNNIPNAITCLNLLSGAFACMFAMRSNVHIGSFYGYEWAFLCIAAAAVFDFFDGFAARLLHAVSGIGKELDSLSDSVSFGLAPAILVCAMMQYNGAGWLSYVPLLIAVFGALRLARFNLDTTQTTSFVGLPIPANAIFWIGYCNFGFKSAYPSDWGVIATVVIFSLLMVCNCRMFSLKFKNLKFDENYQRYLLILAAIVFVTAFGLVGLSLTIIFYVLISLALGNKKA